MSVISDFGELKWSDWLKGLISAGISAAASAVAANPIALVLGAQQFTPRQLGIMAGSSALVAVAGFLQKSPLPDRKVAIALLAGVHTLEQVETVAKATSPGVVPTSEVAASIIADAAKNEPTP